MGFSTPDNSAAEALQKQSLAQNATQNKAMLTLLQAQVDQAKTLKLPKIAPPMPLPDTSSADAIAQSQEQRRNLMSRNGLGSTNVVAQSPVAPLKSAMGTPMFGMAA